MAEDSKAKIALELWSQFVDTAWLLFGRALSLRLAEQLFFMQSKFLDLRTGLTSYTAASLENSKVKHKFHSRRKDNQKPLF